MSQITHIFCKAQHCTWGIDVSPEDPDSSQSDALEHVRVKHDWEQNPVKLLGLELIEE